MQPQRPPTTVLWGRVPSCRPPPSGPHGCPPGPAATQALIVRLGAGCVPEFRTRCCGLVAPFHGGHPRCRLPGSGRVSLGRGVGGGAGGEATK